MRNKHFYPLLFKSCGWIAFILSPFLSLFFFIHSFFSNSFFFLLQKGKKNLLKENWVTGENLFDFYSLFLTQRSWLPMFVIY